MSDLPSSDRSDDCLSFLGRMGADVTHEMRNILAIVGETVGLLKDHLALAETGGVVDHGKLAKLATRISTQVARGTKTMECYSRFSHATDEPTGPTNLTALVEDTVMLAGHRVALAGCELQVATPEDSILVDTDPFRLQYALFSAMELLLKASRTGQVVVVQLTARGGSVTLSVIRNLDIETERTCTFGDPDFSIRTAHLAAVLEEQDCCLETCLQQGTVSLTMTIPAE